MTYLSNLLTPKNAKLNSKGKYFSKRSSDTVQKNQYCIRKKYNFQYMGQKCILVDTFSKNEIFRDFDQNQSNFFRWNILRPRIRGIH